MTEMVNLITTSLSTMKRTLRTRKDKSTGAQRTLGDRNKNILKEKQPANICLLSSDHVKPRLGILAARAALANMLTGIHVSSTQDAGEKCF